MTDYYYPVPNPEGYNPFIEPVDVGDYVASVAMVENSFVVEDAPTRTIHRSPIFRAWVEAAEMLASRHRDGSDI